MTALDWAYVALAAEPFGGILLAIPFAIFKLDYPLWLILVTSPPLAYLQVLVVDAAGGLLDLWPWWLRMLKRKTSPRIRKLMEGQGSFWSTFLAPPSSAPGSSWRSCATPGCPSAASHCPSCLPSPW